MMVDLYGREEEEKKEEGREGRTKTERERIEDQLKIIQCNMDSSCLNGEITNEFSSLCFS